MPVPFPTAVEVDLRPPDAAETRVIAGGVAGAVAVDGELSSLQRMLIESLVESMCGFVVPVRAVPKLEPDEFARAMALRDALFRQRMLQFMLLTSIVLVPLPEAVITRVEVRPVTHARLGDLAQAEPARLVQAALEAATQRVADVEGLVLLVHRRRPPLHRGAMERGGGLVAARRRGRVRHVQEMGVVVDEARRLEHGYSWTSSMRVPKIAFGCTNATVVPREPGRGASSITRPPASLMACSAAAQSFTR
jgi:hypothetical protein